jgi:hypothetical protein
MLLLTVNLAASRNLIIAVYLRDSALQVLSFTWGESARIGLQHSKIKFIDPESAAQQITFQ